VKWPPARDPVSWKGAAIQSGLGLRSRGISAVRSRCQGTAGEDTAGWKLSGCCGDLRIVEISSGAMVATIPESCV
jgi:hypothetical protein